MKKLSGIGLVLICLVLNLSFSSCGGGGGNGGYPISSEVYTTRQWAIEPDPVTSGDKIISPWDPSKFKENGYGLWHYVAGIDYGKDRSIMPADYNLSSAINTASLLNFFIIADTHVYDKESPSQPFYLLMKDVISTINGIPGITFTMLYTTQILDAAIQTVNALHKKNPLIAVSFLAMHLTTLNITK